MGVANIAKHFLEKSTRSVFQCEEEDVSRNRLTGRKEGKYKLERQIANLS